MTTAKPFSKYHEFCITVTLKHVLDECNCCFYRSKFY